MDNQTLMTTWCRMWNEDPALAHEVMTDHCRQWSAQTPGLDTVVGPEEQETFATTYRAQHVNLFRPRLLADGEDQFAYLWDVTLPDGTVWTGADANIVQDGRVDLNWTFVCQQHDDGPDVGAELTDATTLDRLCREWILLCNGEIDTVTDIVTDDVRVFVGVGERATELRGVPALTTHLEQQRAAVPLTTGTVHRRPITDPTRGRAAILWTAHSGTGDDDVEAGGIVLLNVDHGRISHAWLLPGARKFIY
jgi:hypothetical protein